MLLFVIIMIIGFVVAIVKDNGWYFFGIMLFNLVVLLATHTPEELTPEDVYSDEDINRESTLVVRKFESICDKKGGVKEKVVNNNFIQDNTVTIICKDDTYHNFEY